MSRQPFADLPPTPAEHFTLLFYAAVLELMGHVADAFGSLAAGFERFPFLVTYNNELAARGVDGLSAADARTWWAAAVSAWEGDAGGHLPLRALRDAARLDEQALVLLFTVALTDEDARFGPLFEALHGIAGQHHATLGLLHGWHPNGGVARLQRLQQLGLIECVNAESPRAEHALHVSPVLWDVLRGEVQQRVAPWLLYRPATASVPLGDLILAESVAHTVRTLPALLDAGDVRVLIVRGPRHNGRRTLLGALARESGRGVLEISGVTRADDQRWRLAGSLATLLHALPLVGLDLAPAESAELPPLDGYDGPIGVALGPQGGLGGAGVERALTVSVELPDAGARRRHWAQALAAHAGEDLDDISRRVRMTGGHIRRTASLACSYAALAGRQLVTAADVQQASAARNREALESLAVSVPPAGDWSRLAVGGDTQRELQMLESRCRHRESLHRTLGPALDGQLGPGVRALFSGPSGTGKTLAARLLASALSLDLYRVDLSAVVNKYIGETEKNLSRIFACAEELDVILLLDEGDSLLTRRTHVQSSNDRYANLETNYLLQRLETFEGILIVTTNAGERIDAAFQRRMDVVIDFRAPEAAERWLIWQLHLPPSHAVPDAVLSEVAARCTLTGGEIRNVAVHAALLALAAGRPLGADDFVTAIQREYRKLGAVCPLRTQRMALAQSA